MKGTFARLSIRQLVYMAVIVLLLLPLSMLSQPASGTRQGGSNGGQLAQLRATYKLGDTNVGAIDPRSETIRLVSLGLGGIANVILWNQADGYKEKEDWTSYRAVLDNLIHLQPYYPVVWEHQAWNLSYNISSEFDDYRDKYYWVMDGIRFLQRGTTYLENNPRLLQRTGWFVTHKIGRADERVQFRRLFAEDEDFHALQWVQERDNWLFGRAYYQRANDAVDLGGATLNFMEPLLFYSDKVRAQMFSGDAMASDYHLRIEAEATNTTDPAERKKRLAELDTDMMRQIRGRWNVAQADMLAFADRPFADEDGSLYRLAEFEQVEKDRDAKLKELDALSPGLRDELRKQRQAKLSEAERSALRIEPAIRNTEQERLAHEAEQKMFVTDEDLAANIEADKKEAAKALVQEIERLNKRGGKIERGRKLVAFEYWLLRCGLEQGDAARNADRHLALASVAFKIDTDLVAAKREFEAGFKFWRSILDQHPELLKDQTAYNVLDSVKEYQQVLRQLDEPFPNPFILDDMIRALAQQ
jgi:hypothetical protein